MADYWYVREGRGNPGVVHLVEETFTGGISGAWRKQSSVAAICGKLLVRPEQGPEPPISPWCACEHQDTEHLGFTGACTRCACPAWIPAPRDRWEAQFAGDMLGWPLCPACLRIVDPTRR